MNRRRYRLTDRGWTVLTVTLCALTAMVTYCFMPVVPPWV